MKKLPKTLLAFGGLAALYLLLLATLPPNTPTIQAYNLSVTEYHVLALLVGIPLIAVWFASFYGYAMLDEYIELVAKSPEGRALRAISRGLRYLAWGLPLIAILSTILGGLVHSLPRFANASLIIVHYFPIVVALIAFWFISIGGRQLTEIAKVRPSHEAIRWMFGIFTTIGVLFTEVSTNIAEGKPNPYILPMWLILLTIIAPYLYAWFMGLFASYEIFLYSKRSKGLLYSRALRNVVAGIVVTILTSVIFQYTQSDTTRLRRISFNWVFLGVYLLLLLYATGFLLIARGSKQLKRIEEV